MKNLEHFKRELNKENLCEYLICYNCPVRGIGTLKKPCTELLKEWCEKDYVKEARK